MSTRRYLTEDELRDIAEQLAEENDDEKQENKTLTDQNVEIEVEDEEIGSQNLDKAAKVTNEGIGNVELNKAANRVGQENYQLQDRTADVTNEEVTGFSDDSLADEDYSPGENTDNSDSDSEWDLDDEGETEEDDPDETTNEESNEDEAVPFTALINQSKWEPVSDERVTFQFTISDTGVPPDIIQKLEGQHPVEYFLHFIDEEIITLFVEETNRFASQQPPNHRKKMQQWKDTNAEEMKQFIGTIIWMGLMQLPKMRDYWAKKKIYSNPMSTVISRNRYEYILSMFHLSDNSQLRDPRDRLSKIAPFLDLLEEKYKASYIPEESVCIDESNVPFRGRIHFRQYIPNKRHKYGIKVFKLCVSGGYTWAFKVYTGKEKVADMSVAEKVVTGLMEGLLDSGRTLYTDNWYTSVALSKTLIRRNTHLVGTLRANRKNNPRDVVMTKLKKGEKIARQNEDKTVVLKWKDKRDVMMLSTKHDDSMVNVVHHGNDHTKPTMVVNYNQCKAFIDLSDQMAAYGPFLRKTVKWYKRLAFHLITSTTIVNAHHLYKKINNKKMGITEFKEAIVEALVFPPEDGQQNKPSTSTKHTLREYEGQKRVTRKRCSVCYSKMSLRYDSAYARKNAKKVNTFCDICDKTMCLACFQIHKTS